MTTPAESLRVLALARAALEAQVRRGPPPPIAADLVIAGSGVFVSVHCGDELRGCLGTLEAAANLTQAIVRLAEDVAHRDYRFRAITVDELPRLSIEVSILTPPELVHDPSMIEIGRDGLIVEQGRSRGLLLPQVATDHGWDRETFLAQTCVKAGLDADAWRNGATIWRFRAEILGDAPIERAQ